MDDRVAPFNRSVDLIHGMIDIAVDPKNIEREFNGGIKVPNQHFDADNMAISTFIEQGITKAKQLLAIDDVTTALSAVVDSFCNDEYFRSHVRTHPGIIVGSFVSSMVRSRVQVGHRYPLAGDDNQVLAKVELDTGMIWYHRGIMESFINYGRTARNQQDTGTKSKRKMRSAENLYMAIIMPAIHGWSRRLAYLIMEGYFDNLKCVQGNVHTDRYTEQLLANRLYTFSEDHQENKLWIAEAFGDYVIELLLGGEFKIRSPLRFELDNDGKYKAGHYHPAEYIIVDRSFSGETSTETEYRLHKDHVYRIYEGLSWPCISVDRQKLLSQVPTKRPTAFIGELDTVRRKRSLMPGVPAYTEELLWSRWEQAWAV